MFKKLYKKMAPALILALALSLMAAPCAFALNYNGSGMDDENKPISFCGYEVVDSTHVVLFFDKPTAYSGQVNPSMFKLVPHAGGSNLVSSITVSSGYGMAGQYTGTTDSNIQEGTKVVLNLSTALTDYSLYDVTVSGTLMSDAGITLGNYMNRKDLTFIFQNPDAFSSYDGTWEPIVTYVLGDGTSDVSWESNMIVIFDRPINPSSLATFKSNLNSNFRNNTAYRQVPTYESYNVVSNDANSKSTVFYFPMTKDGDVNTIYNRTSSSNSYTLTLPAFTDMDNTTWNNLGSYSFATASSDYPGWEKNASSVSGINNALTISRPSSTSLTVSWYDTWISPCPANYDVYYIDAASGNQYALSWTLAGTASGGSTSQGQQITFTISDGIQAGHTYWVRVVPKNSAGLKAGFSKSNASAI